MHVRPYEPKDREVVCDIFDAQPEKLWFQDPDDRTSVLPLVVEEDGRIVGFAVGRLTVECFLTLRRDGVPPKHRLEVAKTLVEEGARRLWQAGFKDARFPVPNSLFHGWYRRLKQLADVLVDERRYLVLQLERRFGWSSDLG